MDIARIEYAPLPRLFYKGDRALKRCPSPDTIRGIVKYRLKLAGIAKDAASPHDLCSGILTEAALRGESILAAMWPSPHQPMGHAENYFDDFETEDNRAAIFLGV